MTIDAHAITEPHGAITVAPSALVEIVVGAAEAEDGARVRRPRRALAVAIDDGVARVALELAAPYGAVLPELARGVQRRVADALSEMCGLRVEAVDLSIEELEE